MTCDVCRDVISLTRETRGRCACLVIPASSGFIAWAAADLAKMTALHGGRFEANPWALPTEGPYFTRDPALAGPAPILVPVIPLWEPFAATLAEQYLLCHWHTILHADEDDALRPTFYHWYTACGARNATARDRRRRGFALRAEWSHVDLLLRSMEGDACV